MKWIRLTPERAQSLYGIPAEIANGTENTFFGKQIELPREYDDMRPLLAFIRDKKRRDKVTLHIKTIHPETWESDGMLLNPLTTVIGGYLSLDKEGLIGLIDILSSYQERLFAESDEKRQAFEKIEDSKLADFRLHPEWFPNSRQEHYIQAYDPLKRRDDSSVTTILILSKSVGYSEIFWGIIQFPSQALQDRHFKPLDQSHSRIDLDGNGIQELATLLQTQISA